MLDHPKSWERRTRARQIFLNAMQSVFVLSTLVLGAEAQPSAPTAQEILERMAEAYGRANSYHDSGTMRTTFVFDDGRERVTERTFRTAFLRPERLRFEYTETGRGVPSRYIIWAHDGEVRSWTTIYNVVKSAPSIGEAIGSAAGVSGGTSMTVPILLMPDELSGTDAAGARRVVYADPVRLVDETLDRVPYFKLRIKRYDEPSTIWIERETYLIRRIDSTHTFEGFRTEATTVYEPVINGEIDEAQLAFDAPESEGGIRER